MSRTDHATAYMTPEEAKATRKLHARQRQASKLFEMVKHNPSSLADFDAFTQANCKASQSFDRFKAMIGGGE